MNILENGVDSLKKSLFSLNRIDEIDNTFIEFELKDIVIKLHHSIETLVKYLVRQKNEYLIYSKVDEIFKSKFEIMINKRTKDAEINTIQFMDSIHRLFVLYNIQIKEQDYELIKELNDLRNSITHYENHMNSYEIKHLIARILKLMIPIFDNYIEQFANYLKTEGIDTKIEELYQKDEVWILTTIISIQENIIYAGRKIKSYGNELDKRKGEIIKNRNKKILCCKCDICSQNFFVESQPIFNKGSIIDSLGECELCGFTKTREYIYLDQMFKNNFYYKNIMNEKSPDIFYSDMFVENLYVFIDEHGMESNEFLEFRAKLIDKVEIFTIIVRNVLNNYASEIISEFDSTHKSDSIAMYEIMKKFYRMTRLMHLYGNVFKITLVKTWDKLFAWENYRTIINFPVADYETEIDNSIQLAGIKVLEWMKEHEVESSHFVNHGNCRQNKLEDEIFYQITSGGIWGELAGTFASDYGTIDNIDESYIEHIYYIFEEKVSNKKIVYLLIENEISTQFYSDHEYFSNGSKTLFIEAKISKNDLDSQIDVLETKLIGSL